MNMKMKYSVITWFLFILHLKASCQERKVYIVYLGEHGGGRNVEEIEDHHHSFLHLIKGSREEAKACHIHSFKKMINGFTALLTPEEAAKLSEMDGVISVFESHSRRLHTTRSWDFVNILEAGGDPSLLNGEELLRRANYGKDAVVGVLDTGVWPESQSFSDDGMEPVPQTWKGVCETGVEFNSSNCNRKIIGARTYLKHFEKAYGRLDETVNYRSARDGQGHGTHTASTIGGRRVPNASSIGGFANGTASGGAPFARLAIYKVCWQITEYEESCEDGDILAAFDDAINDGVHVISVSIGWNSSLPYERDSIAVGALNALKRNIVVSCSAGNSGPLSSSVEHVAPWLMVVGASSTDRAFPSPVLLGNGIVIRGQSITPFGKQKMHRLVYAGDVEVPGTPANASGLCMPDTLSPALVNGNVVFCPNGDVSEAMEVKRAGGVAAILGNPPSVGNGISDSPFLLPATSILWKDRSRVLSYIRNSTSPRAKLTLGKTVIGTKPAPFMAPFTALGPNGIEPNILKPDITAPGLNILAAWTEASPPTLATDDDRVVKYNIISGTSMSCPHVSAVAALLKAIHPDWSSAAIRSAIMTTAGVTNNIGTPIMDAFGKPATPFHFGSGHIQPSKAVDPGLVYDANYTDYLLFLCSSGSDLSKGSFKCPQDVPSPSNLNYPSLAIGRINGSVTVKRTVTNVGTSNTSYSIKIGPLPGYSVAISPVTLHFSKIGEKQSFNITLTVKAEGTSNNRRFSFGWYMWSDGVHMVRSPIAVAL